MKAVALVFFSCLFVSATLLISCTVSAETGDVGAIVPCLNDSQCNQTAGEICCDGFCKFPECSSDENCTEYNGTGVSCANASSPCDAYCLYFCSEEEGYYSCSHEQFCNTTPIGLGPPSGTIYCCPGLCLECNASDYEPQNCTKNVNGVNCTGHMNCTEPGYWGECVPDDPNCGKIPSAPPVVDDGSGGGSGGGGGGGGGATSRCTEGETRLCGPQIGACEGAVETCIDGKWTECSVLPTEEVCNTLDDDCEGIVDNLYGAVTVEETSCWCVGGQEPVQESCNGIDDDCNGIIDDYADCCFVPGETRLCGPNDEVGICTFGISTCGENELWGECIGAVYPEDTDYCFNELDDDCNGFADDDCEHCLDGVWNGDEEGVDCGGSCLKECFNWMMLILILIIILIISVLVCFFLWKRYSDEKKNK